MDRGRGSLTSSQDTWDNRVALALQDLALPVGGDASHVVVDSWQDWSWLLGDIDTSKDLGSLRDAWETLSQSLRWKVIEVEVDVVLVWANTSAFTDLHGHGATDDITRSQILCVWRISRHEWLTFTVAEDTSLTTAALSEQATSWEDTSRMELHELQVLDWDASTSGHGISVTCARVR